MRFNTNKFLFFGCLLLVLSIAGLDALGSNGRAVSMRAQNQGKFIEVELKINRGFGVQKKGPHEIIVYSLNKNISNEKDIAKAISEYGKKIYEAKLPKLSGINAKQDDEYFSSVNNIQIPVKVIGDVAVKSKIYYCSFSDSFCSVDVLYTILPGK